VNTNEIENENEIENQTESWPQPNTYQKRTMTVKNDFLKIAYRQVGDSVQVINGESMRNLTVLSA
jgi:hypothetical protein